MTEGRRIDSEKYLKKIEGQEWEPLTDPEVLERIHAPLAEVDLSQDGIVEVKTDQVELTFDQVGADSESIKRIAELAASKMPKERDMNKGWKEIQNYSLKTGDGKHEVQLPPGCKVYYINETDREERTGFYYWEQDLDNPENDIEAIILIGDPTAPVGVFTTLHEAGHHVDRHREDRPKVEGWHSQFTKKVYEERAANAYALKKLRPFITSGAFSKNDARDFLIQHALGSHMEGTRRKISTHEYEARKMGKDYDMEAEEQEMMERERWDYFQEWKETQEYQDWKQMFEHKDLEDWEEYAVWCEEQERLEKQ